MFVLSWRKQEKRLNKYPQFKTNIEGIDIHFVRATPSKLKPGQRAKPIMMVHGWPGSFYEFFKVKGFIMKRVQSPI